MVLVINNVLPAYLVNKYTSKIYVCTCSEVCKLNKACIKYLQTIVKLNTCIRIFYLILTERCNKNRKLCNYAFNLNFR